MLRPLKDPTPKIYLFYTFQRPKQTNVCYVLLIGFVNLLLGPRRDLMLTCLQESQRVRLSIFIFS